MVGIVFVSHSARLAEGVKELALQMVQGTVPIAVAAGIDDPENPIGTDAMKVYEAIQSVYGEDGVVVLMDLGSALLSAETALEFFEPDQQEKIALCAAPFVEGALAAAVQASVGGTREQVVTEAEGALSVKMGQLGITGGAQTAPAPAPAARDTTGEQSVTLTVANRLGLHARPAAKFVSTANQYAANIRVHKDDAQANAKSINQVAKLGVRQGEAIAVTAEGVDAAAALDALRALVEANFGEDEHAEELPANERERPPVAEKDVLAGVPASPGIAIGPAAFFRAQLPVVEERKVSDPDAEWRRLQAALASSATEIDRLQKEAVRQVGADEAAIFEAHALFLEDPDLLDSVRTRIFGTGVNAEAAWDHEIAAAADALRALDNPYMQARAADVEDVGQRVLSHLLDVQRPSFAFAEPSILMAGDLSPSDTAQLDPGLVLGICTEMGGATSHSAILARALGIPAIVGLGKGLWAPEDGQEVAMDGARGLLWLQPEEGQLQELRQTREAWLAKLEQDKNTSSRPAVTTDGRTIEVAANIGGPHDVAVALDYGAEGVGLFRTEFLFMDRELPPSEEEQYEVYRQVADALGDKPLIIRTLDVGGDKPLPYLDLGQEANPFLGWRGIRFCLDKPEVFKPQLRAVLRASHDRNVKLMFPMIGSVTEIREAKAQLREAQEELEQAGLPFNPHMEIGIMIEVPSAVVMADLLAAEVDFFSIGTNDLTQYTMAADRGNASVEHLAQALNPAVLRMVKQAADAARAANIWIGMCGELAGNAKAAPLLLGLGLDELSMSAPSIPAVKEAIRSISQQDAQALALAAVNLDSAQAVSDLLAGK